MNRISTLCLAALAAALTGCAAAPPATQARGAFSFALIGDMPYSAREEAMLDELIDTINVDPSVSFVMHAGDIKDGGEPCSDALIRARYEQLQRIRTALVYTPGDNEWTDCHRPAAGRFNPLQRLAFVRSLFFRDPHRTSGQHPFAVEPQSVQTGFGEYVENALFMRERVVFATLHIVGSDNGLVPWTGFDATDTRARPRADRLAEVERRTAAALEWIDEAFARARATDAAGVFLLMQANPRFDLPPTHAERLAFEPLLQRLRARSLAFGRPVVLAHGDFHELIIDQPLAGAEEEAPVPNLTRVQTFGSPRIRWIRVRVDPASPALFVFEPK
jgi:hypothetical protein